MLENDSTYHQEDHSKNFSSEADHNAASAILDGFSHDPHVFSVVKNSMRLDLTDQEFLSHIRENFIPHPDVEGGSIDNDWSRFKASDGANPNM